MNGDLKNALSDLQTKTKYHRTMQLRRGTNARSDRPTPLTSLTCRNQTPPLGTTLDGADFASPQVSGGGSAGTCSLKLKRHQPAVQELQPLALATTAPTQTPSPWTLAVTGPGLGAGGALLGGARAGGLWNALRRRRWGAKSQMVGHAGKTAGGAIWGEPF